MAHPWWLSDSGRGAEIPAVSRIDILTGDAVR